MRILQRCRSLWLLCLVVLAAVPSAAAQEESADRAAALQSEIETLLGEGGYNTVAVTIVEAPDAGEGGSLEESADAAFGQVNTLVASFFFYDVGGKTADSVDAEALLANPGAIGGLVDQLRVSIDDAGMDAHRANVTLTLPGPGVTDVEAVMTATSTGIPLAVLWLIIGATFFTLRMGFVQLRAFGHAIRVTAGHYDNPEDEGEVSHFQALTAALSATVGLGNIASVAIAISVGGPGAVLWMVLAGFLGMASKFTECSLGQMYRQTRSDGSFMGGAMYYLSNGLKEMGLGALGKFLAVFFAVLCVFASFGGGNAFQVNQSLNAIQEVVPFLGDNRWLYGLVMAGLVGVVIIGGIKRIAHTAEKIVPFMCTMYVAMCLWVLISNIGAIPGAIGTIFSMAFTPEAGYGGLIGVLVQGFRRAAFSNEAGVGSAAIAHSAAKTPYAVREGIVALLEPFIDTIVVCTMTALVIVVTGAWQHDAPLFAPFHHNANGAGLTSTALSTTVSWFPTVLSIAVLLFAYSTMISWSYYGERCWVWMFGDKTSMVYKLLFLTFVFLGSIVTAQNVLEFGDLMILGMAIPNVLGVLLLSGKVKRALDDYMGKLKSGDMPMYK